MTDLHDPPGRAELDLTPRAVEGPRRRRPLAWLLVAVVVVALGFVIVKMLDQATLFFYNADEAVQQQDQLGDDRFRLQGAVLPGTVVETPTGVDFTVAHEGARVAVVHTGAPPELFAEGMPVVLEGAWAGDVYESDEILVKHDEVYVEENGDRIAEAEREAESVTGADDADPSGAEGSSGAEAEPSAP